MAMMALDPTITFTGVTIAPSISVKPILAEQPAAPSIANPAKARSARSSPTSSTPFSGGNHDHHME
jgi:hypothetical protein